MRKRFRISSLIVHLLGLISLALLLSILAYSNLTVTAKTWDYKYKAFLPDSAFAAIETDAHGKKARHLPHHDHQGNLDIPHLLNALARFKQVKWLYPDSEEPAKAHLLEHYREYKNMKNK